MDVPNGEVYGPVFELAGCNGDSRLVTAKHDRTIHCASCIRIVSIDGVLEINVNIYIQLNKNAKGLTE